MNIAGIDYSITCPAMVYGDSSISSFDDLKIITFATKKRHMSLHKNLTLLEYPLYKSNEERYDKVSEYFYKKIIEEKVERVLIEGYSYNSAAGQVFNIAENCAILKYKLYKSGIEYSDVPPATVKKFFTGRGNCNKGIMYTTFVKEHQTYDLHLTIGDKESNPDTIGNPVSDIIDAYAIWLYNKKTL